MVVLCGWVLFCVGGVGGLWGCVGCGFFVVYEWVGGVGRVGLVGLVVCGGVEWLLFLRAVLILRGFGSLV